MLYCAHQSHQSTVAPRDTVARDTKAIARTTCRAIALFLALTLAVLAGCAKSPLRQYELASSGYVVLSDTMVALKESGAISHDTLATFDTVATPVGAAIKAWGLAIVQEYGRPKEQRNYARIEHLANIALKAWNQLKQKWPPQ